MTSPVRAFKPTTLSPLRPLKLPAYRIHSFTGQVPVPVPSPPTDIFEKLRKRPKRYIKPLQPYSTKMLQPALKRPNVEIFRKHSRKNQ
jgi:hypothetical protein